MTESTVAADLPQDLLCSRDAARLLGVRTTTLSAWRARRRGPRYIKYARTVLYSRAEIEAFRRAAMVCPGALVAK